MKSIEDLLEIKEKIQLLESETYCLKVELNDGCWHPAEQQETKSQYYKGGYDYKAETIYWQECKICGHKQNQTVKQHSWYG